MSASARKSFGLTILTIVTLLFIIVSICAFVIYASSVFRVFAVKASADPSLDESVVAIIDIIFLPVFGGIVVLCTLLGVLLFFICKAVAKRARRIDKFSLAYHLIASVLSIIAFAALAFMG